MCDKTLWYVIRTFSRENGRVIIIFLFLFAICRIQRFPSGWLSRWKFLVWNGSKNNEGKDSINILVCGYFLSFSATAVVTWVGWQEVAEWMEFPVHLTSSRRLFTSSANSSLLWLVIMYTHTHSQPAHSRRRLTASLPVCLTCGLVVLKCLTLLGGDLCGLGMCLSFNLVNV